MADAYAFNPDRSKAPVYTKEEIDQIDLMNDQALAQEASARQAADGLLQTQIDGIIALPDGSTTADAELVNIRTGHDGMAYDAAGNAVRSNDREIAETVNSLISKFTDVKPITYSVYNNRIKVFSAFYWVENNIIHKVLIIKLIANLTSANTWTLGTLTPSVINISNTAETFDCISLDNDDVSNITFKQNANAANNLEAITAASVAAGYGGLLLLTHDELMASNTYAFLPDTSYPVELIDKTANSENLFSSANVITGRAIQQGQGSASISIAANYSCILLRVVGGSSILVKGLTESLSYYGYAIKDVNNNFVKNAGEQPNMIIDIPDNGYLLMFTFPSDDDIELIPFKKQKVVVLGDSWSDNNPAHTTYTKWPTLLNNDGRYNVIVYAQNGSTITGATPSYQQNGNVLGQVNQLLADDIDNVDIIVLFGGINDFRGGITVGSLKAQIVSFYNTLNARYPNARIIYIANNQIYITDEQLSYFHEIVDYVRLTAGIESYLTFGWVSSSHYISDLVHVDDDGYRDLYANILSILTGGTISTVREKYKPSNYLTLYEDWINGYPKYSAEVMVNNADLNTLVEYQISADEGNILASVPFAKTLNKLYPTSATMPTGTLACDIAKNFNTTSKSNTNNVIKVFNASANSGAYVTDDLN